MNWDGIIAQLMNLDNKSMSLLQCFGFIGPDLKKTIFGKITKKVDFRPKNVNNSKTVGASNFLSPFFTL